MSLLRLVSLGAAWLILAYAVHRPLSFTDSLLEPRALAWTLGLPALAAAATHGPARFAAAVGDALRGAPRELPPERRLGSAAIVRSFGGFAVAAGLLASFVAVVIAFQRIAIDGGQASSYSLVAGSGMSLAAPALGLALRFLLCEPLAAALEGAGDGLAAELEADSV